MRQAVSWDPCQHVELYAKRRPHRPKRRWIDDIFHFISKHKETLTLEEQKAFADGREARDAVHLLLRCATRDAWNDLEQDFCQAL